MGAIDPVAIALLRRSGLVAPGLLAAGRKVKDRGLSGVPASAGVNALEADALAHGYLLSPALRAYLLAQQPTRLASIGLNLLDALAQITGGNVPHVPLFRDFPRRIPHNTFDLWVKRVFVLLMQLPYQPCVLCGKEDSLRAVSPCAHLVCQNCWDMGNYSGCPICHQRIDENCCFYPVPDKPDPGLKLGLPKRAVVLHLAEQLNDAVYATVSGLLQRQTPLTPQDRGDLAAMLDFCGHGDLSWLPARIPVRETRALILARVAEDPKVRAHLPEVLAVQADTATDMLRLLYLLQGGDAGLDTAPRRRLSPTRWLRRTVLEFLDSLAFPALVEDLHRHRAAWLSTSEFLHPFEYASRFPRAATAFATLRGTAVDEAHPFVAVAAAWPRAVRFDGTRLRALTFAAQAESTLDLSLLTQRPGDFVRRLVSITTRIAKPNPRSVSAASLSPAMPADRQADLAAAPRQAAPSASAGVLVDAPGKGVPSVGPDELAAAPRQAATGGHPAELVGALREAVPSVSPDELVVALRETVPSVSPGVLIAAIGAVRSAAWPAVPRLFAPRGGAALLWTQPDDRARMEPVLAASLEAVLVDELLTRAEALPKVPAATVDSALRDLLAPFTDRTAAKALVRLPRGSSQPLPSQRVVRLFLHWTQPEKIRVDLDLSVAMFNETGALVGWCDFTRLKFAGGAAIHSGDLTSAPGPLGASEFVDLNLGALRKAGVRYVTMVVFSYNDVAFEAMTDAFAGLMGDPGRGEPFVPKAVEQRFDLTGNSKVATPLILDIGQSRMRWIDAKLASGAGVHHVGRYSRTMGMLTVAAEKYFAAGHRVSLWELACWHAAGRADLVQVKRENGWYASYLRGTGEPLADFASRILTQAPPDDESATAEPASFAALMRADAPLAEHAELYSLYPAGADANKAALLDAADLIGLLAPGAETGVSG